MDVFAFRIPCVIKQNNQIGKSNMKLSDILNYDITYVNSFQELVLTVSW